MAGHKTTHTQLERFRLIDSLFADGEVIPFEKILDYLRTELRDSLLSESSLRRDFRYMKNELKAPLAYDKKLHGWYYTKPFKLPAEGFSDDEILYLKLIRGLVGQNSNDDFLYQSFDKLLEKITPEITNDQHETPKQDRGDSTQVRGDDIQPHGDSLRHAVADFLGRLLPLQFLHHPLLAEQPLLGVHCFGKSVGIEEQRGLIGKRGLLQGVFPVLVDTERNIADALQFLLTVGEDNWRLMTSI